MWWSWGLALAGIVGLVFAGKKKKIGWALGVLTQFLWMTYAIATHQYGFILGSCAYAFVYGRNYYLWHKEEKALNEVQN
jgi:lipid-A-disaccharide synthase-like uncharacterized protein